MTKFVVSLESQNEKCMNWDAEGGILRRGVRGNYIVWEITEKLKMKSWIEEKVVSTLGNDLTQIVLLLMVLVLDFSSLFKDIKKLTYK